jgi:uncharacterized damage-inducible protein DinB
MDATDLLTHFRRQRAWTRELVAVLPDELFEWVPEGSGFTCGGLVRHLIQAEIFWAGLLKTSVAGEVYDPLGLPGSFEERMESFRDINVGASRGDALGSTAAECLESWNGVQEKMEGLIAGLDATALETRGVHPLTGLEAPVWELVLVMIEHEAHHRGQLSAYLKARDVKHPSTLWS